MDCGVSESLDASHSADENTEDSEVGDFECNICFDLAQDPIVALCGHIYCWPCLYQWLQVHSYSHECPVCKAIIEEEKLVPIYGRGKRRSNPRTCQTPGISIPNRPLGQTPQTAPRIEVNYFRQDELDPTSTRRFGNLTLSSLFGIIPAVFSFWVRRIDDAFSSLFQGGYAHGFHRSPRVVRKQFFLTILFLIACFIVLLSLILCSLFS